MSRLRPLIDGLANGWPPYRERLPGPYQVAGYERSIDPKSLSTAEWTLSALGPGNRFAVDFGNYHLLASYGYQNPIRFVAYLYTSQILTVSDVHEARYQALKYVLVDRRLSESLPVSGQYFANDPNAGRYIHPLVKEDLDKFNMVPGGARVYDSGNIVIYQLWGS